MKWFLNVMAVRERMHELGLSQHDLGLKLGVHKSRLSKMLAAKVSIRDIDLRWKLTEVLGMEAHALFTRQSEVEQVHSLSRWSRKTAEREMVAPSPSRSHVAMVTYVANEMGLPVALVRKAVNGYLEAVQEALFRDGQAILKGIGKLYVRATEARQRFIPAHGEWVMVPAHNQLKFRAYSESKRLIQGRELVL